MRLEAVRQANNAAVLRQQVFHFDPNYYPYLNAVGGADPGNANFTGIPGAGQPAVGVAAGQPAVAASSTHSNMAGYAQDLHANNSMGSKFPYRNSTCICMLVSKYCAPIILYTLMTFSFLFISTSIPPF